MVYVVVYFGGVVKFGRQNGVGMGCVWRSWEVGADVK